MPIYEYSCQDCGARFEKLVRSGDEVACPSCGEKRLRQELSVFAAHAHSASKAPQMPAPCAGCRNPNACGFN